VREALLQLLKGERPAAAVWTADLGYWLHARAQDGTAKPEWMTTEGRLHFLQGLGIMPYYECGLSSYQTRYDDTVEVSQELSGAKTLTRYRTPVGTLLKEETYLPQSFCKALTRHPVGSERDLDVLLHIVEHRRLVPLDMQAYRERAETAARYGGIPILAVPRSPLPEFFYDWAGVQAAVLLLADCGDQVRRVLQAMEHQGDDVLESVCAASPPLVHFCDNLTSATFTGLYDEFMARPYGRHLDRLHAAGVKCAVHLDGTVRGLLPKLTAVGFDAIEALTPKPVGDVDLADMRELAGRDSVILWGGVPGAMFAPPYGWDDMRKHVARLLDCWEEGPFILGTADQVPPDGDIEFCRRIADLVRERRYH
jgi:hypothetical protein